jgi:hypothetical protein
MLLAPFEPDWYWMYCLIHELWVSFGFFELARTREYILRFYSYNGATKRRKWTKKKINLTSLRMCPTYDLNCVVRKTPTGGSAKWVPEAELLKQQKTEVSFPMNHKKTVSFPKSHYINKRCTSSHEVDRGTVMG